MCVIVLVFVAGCIGPEAGGSASAEEILAEADDYDGFDDVHGEVRFETHGFTEYRGHLAFLGAGISFETVSETGDGEEYTADIMLRSTGELRTDVYTDSELYEVTVFTDSEYIRYEADDGWYTRTEVDRYEDGRFDFESLVGDFEFEHVGSETVAGRDAHLLQGVSLDEDSPVEEIRLWMDYETLFPLRSEAEAVVDGDEHVTTWEFTEVEFDKGFDDKHFDFEKPEDATDVEETTETYEVVPEEERDEEAVIEEVSEDIGYGFGSVDDERYELRYAQSSPVYDANPDAVLRYEDTEGDENVSLWVNDRWDGLMERGTEVEAGEGTAMFREMDGSNFFDWRCAGDIYTLAGDVGSERMVEIAEDVCLPR